MSTYINGVKVSYKVQKPSLRAQLEELVLTLWESGPAELIIPKEGCVYVRIDGNTDETDISPSQEEILEFVQDLFQDDNIDFEASWSQSNEKVQALYDCSTNTIYLRFSQRR